MAPSTQGPVSRKPRERFGPAKQVLVDLYLKTERRIRLKLLVKFLVKSLFVLYLHCHKTALNRSHKVWDFATVFWVRKRGETGPRYINGYRRILYWGVILQWTSIQSRGNRHTPSRFLLLKLDESLGSYANFTCCPGYPFSVYAVSIKVYWIYTKCPTRHFMHHLSQNLQFHSRAAKCFGARKIQMMDFLRVYKHVSLWLVIVNMT